MNFADSLAGEFTPGIGVIDTPVESTTPTEPVLAGVQLQARLTVHVPPPVIPAPVPRLVGSLVLEPDVPAIRAGKPVVPAFWARGRVRAQALQGVGHIRTFSDPDPQWNGASWDVPPPPSPAGSHFLRWSARTLPDPAAQPGGIYPLGIRGSFDGTAGLPTEAGRWRTAGGSDYTIDWLSDYPFKPTVGAHVHYGSSGKRIVQGRAVFFTPGDVSHMWADLGTILDPPFTIMIALIVTGYTGTVDSSYVFDGGADPRLAVTNIQRATWANSGMGGAVRIPENYGYRTAMLVRPSSLTTWTDTNSKTRQGRVSYSDTRAPQLLTMVIDGSRSRISAHYPTMKYGSGHRAKAFTAANHGPQRFLVLGRANGILDTEHASAMAVFEIRMWDKALTEAQVQQQYNQLSSTWRFTEYRP